MLIKVFNFFDTLKNTPAKKNKLLVSLTIVSLALNLGLWIFLFWQLQKILARAPDINAFPLHYNVYFGIDLYGKIYRLYLIPLVGLIIWIINTILTMSLYSKKSLTGYFLTAGSLLSQIFLAVSAILIILINN